MELGHGFEETFKKSVNLADDHVPPKRSISLLEEEDGISYKSRRSRVELGLGFEEAFKNSVSIADDLPPERLTLESADLLEDGISLVLSEWTVIRKYVAEELVLGYSGRRYVNSSVRLKSKLINQIHSEIFNWFTQSQGPLKTADLRALIIRELRRAYKLTLLDGSTFKVACKLMHLYKDCLQKSACRRRGEAASLIDRRMGQSRRLHGARQKPY